MAVLTAPDIMTQSVAGNTFLVILKPVKRDLGDSNYSVLSRGIPRCNSNLEFDTRRAVLLMAHQPAYLLVLHYWYSI